MSNYINAFPGYEKVVEYVNGRKEVHNMYRGTDLGLGGYNYFEAGQYRNVVLLDVNNMHGASIIALNKFGDHTKVFADVREANLAIKHKEFDKLKTLMGGALAPYLDDPNTDWKSLRAALKLVSNSTFGVSFASFEGPLRDSRDDNDIIALRGALFMRTLQDEVTARGFKVAHIKTDSIKIPDATPEIVQFCMDFAKKYSYEFEFEAVYSKFCIVDKATYIAKHMSTEECKKRFNYIPGENKEAEETGHLWTATADQFQVPYVFKTLFSHEEITFDDVCETKSVKEGALYLDVNELLPDVTEFEGITNKYEQALRKRKLLDGEKMYQSRPIMEIEKDVQKNERAIQRFQLYLRDNLVNAEDLSDEDLLALSKKHVANGHDLQFIGRVGQFTPVKDGNNGGWLLRIKDGTKSSVQKTKKPDGTLYRWVESARLRGSDNWKEIVDRSYYTILVDKAVEAISQYGDFEEFVGDDNSTNYIPADFMNPPEEAKADAREEIPFEEYIQTA